MNYFFFLASLTDFLSRGFPQYGDLQPGQFLVMTDLPSSSSRGHHLCPHLKHSNCSTSTFFPKSVFMSNYMIYYLAYILCVVNNIYARVHSIVMEQVKINTAFPRLEKALEMMDKVQIIDQTRALVKSQSSSKVYEVSMIDQTCTCPDYVFRGVKCKHQRAVSLYQQKIATTMNKLENSKE